MNRFDAQRFERLRAERGLVLGAQLVYSELTGSTNDDALAAARSGALHGTTFVADAQNQGRGRRGRSWFAAPGESLLCSVLLRSTLKGEAMAALSLAVGLAVREAVGRALSEREESVRVKWPNDVWVGEKKVAGVLCEAHVQRGVPLAVVVGFGVNVTTRSFPPELAPRSSSLALCGGLVTREELLLDALSALEARLLVLETAGVAAIAREVSARDALAGRKVCVDGVTGVAAGIDPKGHLLLRQSRGEMVSVLAGSVELLD